MSLSPVEHEREVRIVSGVDGARALLAAASVWIGLVLAIVAGVALDQLRHAPRAGIALGLVVFVLVARLLPLVARRGLVPAVSRRVRLDADGLALDGVAALPRNALHECVYDAVGESLVLVGALGRPLAVISMPIVDAAHAQRILRLPERRVRTFLATSIPSGLPYVGFWIVGASGCMVALALVMLVGGPLHVALMLLAVAMPLGTALVPSRIHVGDGDVTRRWLWMRETIALVEIRDARITDHCLVLSTRSGERRWRLRHETRQSGVLGEALYARWWKAADATNRAILAMLHARIGTAIATVFE